MIVAIGGAHRANGLGLADGGRNLRIAARFAEWDPAKLPPNRFLECRTGDVDRQVRGGVRMLDRRQCTFDQLPEAAIVLHDRRPGEKPAQGCLAVVER